ncbi:hypothetical protein [Streptacidiphilus cavernicola]|uniref:Secreted protein n=1 Tax=Streptacidiphilus cavernicola TaxID=3342716 RepID=A0ABV6W4J0_9ACTN
MKARISFAVFAAAAAAAATVLTAAPAAQADTPTGTVASCEVGRAVPGGDGTAVVEGANCGRTAVGVHYDAYVYYYNGRGSEIPWRCAVVESSGYDVVGEHCVAEDY